MATARPSIVDIRPWQLDQPFEQLCRPSNIEQMSFPRSCFAAAIIMFSKVQAPHKMVHKDHPLSWHCRFKHCFSKTGSLPSTLSHFVTQDSHRGVCKAPCVGLINLNTSKSFSHDIIIFDDASCTSNRPANSEYLLTWRDVTTISSEMKAKLSVLVEVYLIYR